VDVVVATAGASPDAVLVRLNPKGGVAFGRQKGGAFEPLAAPVAFPPAKPNQPPYRELKYERAGGVLSAWFDGRPLGQTPAAGLRTTELRVHATGGPVRIESAEVAELVTK
jgi:hypothetical protein